jgi:predicted RecA/RadA family phage recombinase
MQATYKRDSDIIEHTPSAAVSAGDILNIEGLAAVADRDIAASATGSARIRGRFRVAKKEEAMSRGQDVFWDDDGDPYNGTSGDGCATIADSGNIRLGRIAADAASTDETVEIDINEPANPLLTGLLWEAVTLASSSKTLDAQDVGKCLNVTAGHASNVITLPATAAGLRYVIRAGVAGANIMISPNTNDKIMGPDLAGTDNKDRILASSQEGDFVILEADASAGWYIRAQRGTWTNES